MSKPSQSSKRRVFVEGPDDLWTIINLLLRHGYPSGPGPYDRPYVWATDGVEKMLVRDLVSEALKSLDRVGFVLDADLSPTDRWMQIRGLVVASGISLPEKPDPNGTVVDLPEGKRVGIWLMPDNRSPGVLEDLLKKLVPAGDATWAHAVASTQAALALEAPHRLEAKDEIKGSIYAWLAWRHPPGMPFGTALKAHILGHESEEALEFVDWFKRLFGAW